MTDLMKTFKFVPAVYKGEKNEDGKKEQWGSNINGNELHETQHIEIKTDDKKQNH